MAIDFNEELLKYNQKLSIQESPKDDVDSQSLTDEERDALPIVMVKTPKENSSVEINVNSFEEGESEDPEDLILLDPKEEIEIEDAQIVSEKEEIEIEDAEIISEKENTTTDPATLAEELTSNGFYITEGGEFPVTFGDPRESIAEPFENVDYSNPRSNVGRFPKAKQSGDNYGGEGDNFNSIYQPVGSDIKDVGKIIARSTGFPANGEGFEDRYEKIKDNLINGIDIFDPNAKIENSMTSNDLTFFLYNMVPYVVGKAAALVGGVVDGVEAIADGIEQGGGNGTGAVIAQWGTIRNVLDNLHNLSYYNSGELLKSLGTNFYTLQILPFLKGVDVKIRRMSLFGGAAKSFTGLDAEENLKGGEETSLANFISNIANGIKDFFKGVADSISGQGEKQLPDNMGYLQAIHAKLQETRDELEEHILEINQKNLEGAKVWQYGTKFQRAKEPEGISGGSVDGLETNAVVSSTKEELRVPGSIEITRLLYRLRATRSAGQEYNEFLDNQQSLMNENGQPLEDALKRVKDETGNSWKDFAERITRSVSQVITNTGEVDPNIIGLSKNLGQSYLDAFENNYSDVEKLNESNEDIGRIINFEKLNEAKGKSQNSFNQFQQRIDSIKNFRTIHSIGYIIVYPTLGEGQAFKIPFQFNPTVEESGTTARYETQQLLHRQGNIYSYVGTEGQTVSLETEYLMTTDGSTDETTERTDTELGHDGSVTRNPAGPEDAWYSHWTPQTVQAIERALRSIALPQVSGTDNDLQFHRPPMVKVVFGSGRELPTPYDQDNLHPMLTYPISSGDTVKYYHRTYLVTKVHIQKDMAETPLYIDISKGDSRIVDTHGFKVSMELSEVDSNYVGILPNFGDYWNSFRGQVEQV